MSKYHIRERNANQRRGEIMTYICDYITTNPVPPTVREITDNTSITSTSVTAYHLLWLEAKGYIRRESHKSRHITVLKAWEGGL